MKKNISKLYTNFLGKNRKKVLNQLISFSDIAFLGGGTALCMQLKHRKSYDFDLFVNNSIEKSLMNRVVNIFDRNIKILVDTSDELSLLISKKIKLSFIYFPFPHIYSLVKTNSIPVLHWKDIASDKAYAIGRRGEYRDYVDIFYIISKGFNLGNVIEDAEKKFGGAFSSKLFLSQLVYFDDLEDFTVDFIGREYSFSEIKEYLELTVSKYINNKEVL
jgi:hypothetical protein